MIQAEQDSYPAVSYNTLLQHTDGNDRSTDSVRMFPFSAFSRKRHLLWSLQHCILWSVYQCHDWWVDRHGMVFLPGWWSVFPVCVLHGWSDLPDCGYPAYSFHIPDRIKEGYGINESIIRKAAEDNVDIIITCDNGISAIDQIRLAKELGLKVIVTDHHDIPFIEKEEEYVLYVEKQIGTHIGYVSVGAERDAIIIR